jgi:peptidoglycan biosynthesis protein MviN/MurJ (putative lipid II flippase)
MRLFSPRELRAASRSLAVLTVIGAVVGFAYDSLVVAAFGPGVTTDAYFLALGVVWFLPILYYLAATNVITPALSATTLAQSPDWRRGLATWVFTGVLSGAAVIALRTPLSIALSNDAAVRAQIRACLLPLAVIPALAAFSEFQRARLLARGRYAATGFYAIARNVGMAGTALLLRPRSAEGLGVAVLVGYAVQVGAVELFRIASRAPTASLAAASSRRNGWLDAFALRSLMTQGGIFGVGYVAVLFERAIAGHLGPGYPTVFSYSYRIVSMLGSVAITSVTVPAVAELAQALAAGGRERAARALQQVFDAAMRLALPAALFLPVVGLPLARFLAPSQAGPFALVISLYGLSLVGWCFVRPWSTLEYARGVSRTVFGVTTGQSGATILCGFLALWAGAPVLAIGPLVGAAVACALAWRFTGANDRQLLRGGMLIRPRWLLKWVAVAGGVSIIVLVAGSVHQGRLAALAICFLAGATFLMAAWMFGLLHEEPLADGVARTPETTSSISA